MRFENLNLGDGSRTAEEEGKTLKSTYMKKKNGCTSGASVAAGLEHSLVASSVPSKVHQHICRYTVFPPFFFSIHSFPLEFTSALMCLIPSLFFFLSSSPPPLPPFCLSLPLL